MSSSVDELVRALEVGDFNEQALALARLVELGEAATPALVDAFNHAGGSVRERIAQGLAEIGDPRAAATLTAALGDPNQQVRARGAQGLAEIGDPGAIDALVRTIDDLPDLLHYPETTSTTLLASLGPPALPTVAPLLKAADPVTREHAFLVVQRVVAALMGAERYQELWRSLGKYDPVQWNTENELAAGRWIDWIGHNANRREPEA